MIRQFVSPGYYKNYSVQPSPSIVQLYVLRKLLLDYVKVPINIKFSLSEPIRDCVNGPNSRAPVLRLFSYDKVDRWTLVLCRVADIAYIPDPYTVVLMPDISKDVQSRYLLPIPCCIWAYVTRISLERTAPSENQSFAVLGKIKARLP